MILKVGRRLVLKFPIFLEDDYDHFEKNIMFEIIYGGILISK